MDWPPVKNKRDMYRRLALGEFGNTIPMYFSLADWERCEIAARHAGLWGVRSAVIQGDPRLRLNVPRDEVATYVRRVFPDGGMNISPMVDPYAVLRGEVHLSDYGEPFGLRLFYVPPGKEVAPGEDPWRGRFKRWGAHAHGVTAREIIRYYLWPSDWADIEVLLDRYPGHVVEFSACDRAVGLVPGRNTCVWEVRAY
jgi:hypothetical protein